MRIPVYFLAFVAWWAWVAGGMLADIGEAREAFTVEWWFPVVFSLMVWACFIVGFFAGKENRK